VVIVSVNGFNSAIYKGWVQHRRLEPKKHHFKYQVFMMYLDLDEVEEVLGQSFMWSHKKFSPARFKCSDYLGQDNSSLKPRVLDKVEASLGFRPSGSVRLLTNCRYFGFIMNPLSIYYCFDEKDRLQAMLLEVTNTPWKERHQYVLACDPAATVQRISFNKQMHVSPFHPMNMMYLMTSNLPAEQLQFLLSNSMKPKPESIVFDASLSLQRTEISSGSLAKVILGYPFMTLKVLLAIYWQALKLIIRRVPFYPYTKRAA